MENVQRFFKRCLSRLRETSMDDSASASVISGNRKQEDLVQSIMESSGFEEYKRPRRFTKSKIGYPIKVLFHRGYDFSINGEESCVLHVPLSEIDSDKIYFIRQPFGTQKKPDFIVFRKDGYRLRWFLLECKSAKVNTATWNDSYPMRNIIYMFTKYKNKNRLKTCVDTTLFMGDRIMTDSTERQLESVRNKLKILQKEDNKTLSECSISLYYRIKFSCSEKHLLVPDRDIREKEVLHHMLNRLDLTETSDSESDSISNSDPETEIDSSLSDEDDLKILEPVKAISLFSGCGGDTLGMVSAGIKVIAFSENDKNAVKTHKANFKESEWLGEDIKGDIQDIPDSVFSEYKDTVDMLFAGFPCQGHSHAGKKDSKDPRNQLFREFVRVTDLVRPRWIIGENVKGILKRKTSSGDNFVDIIIRCFEEIGYKIKFDIVKATNYGIPQLRERFIMVGSRDNEEFKIYKGVSTLKPSIRSIINFDMNGAVQIEETDVEVKDDKKITWVTEPDDYEEPDHLDPPHPFLVKNISLNRVSFETRFTPNHGEVMNLDKPSKTIICAYSFQPRLYIGMKRKNNTYWLRTLRLKELQQIQGFPESFLFKGKENNIIKQIGNAIPPKIINQIVSRLI